MKNNTGPKTEPCGTPKSTGTEEDDFPSSTTFNLLRSAREKRAYPPQSISLYPIWWQFVKQSVGERLYQMLLQSPSLQYHFECLPACYMLCHEQILWAEFRSYVFPENRVVGDKECYSFWDADWDCCKWYALRAYMKYRSNTQDDSWMGLSYLPSYKLG